MKGSDCGLLRNLSGRAKLMDASIRCGGSGMNSSEDGNQWLAFLKAVMELKSCIFLGS